MKRSMLSRSSQIAVAAMGYMAELYKERERRLTPKEIAESRDFQAPYVAKVMTELSRAKLIEGARGPGGGYRLAKSPGKITLKQITDVFEREDNSFMCPYGKDYCGTGPHCPLHDEIETLNKALDRFLAKTTLAGFARRKKE